MPYLEGEAASAYTLGLIADLSKTPTTDGNAHPLEPFMQISAKLDIARLGSQRFRLQS